MRPSQEMSGSSLISALEILRVAVCGEWLLADM